MWDIHYSSRYFISSEHNYWTRKAYPNGNDRYCMGESYVRGRGQPKWHRVIQAYQRRFPLWLYLSGIKTCSEFEAENEFKMNQQSIVLIAEPKQVEQVEVTQPVTEASTTQPAIVSKPTNNETGNSFKWAKFWYKLRIRCMEILVDPFFGDNDTADTWNQCLYHR